MNDEYKMVDGDGETIDPLSELASIILAQALCLFDDYRLVKCI